MICVLFIELNETEKFNTQDPALTKQNDWWTREWKRQGGGGFGPPKTPPWLGPWAGG